MTILNTAQELDTAATSQPAAEVHKYKYKFLA